MLTLMKQIRQIIGHTNVFKVEIYDTTICFNIYEVEVNLVFDGEFAYIDCFSYDYKIYPAMLKEIDAILDLIIVNKDKLKEILEVGDVL